MPFNVNNLITINRLLHNHHRQWFRNGSTLSVGDDYLTRIGLEIHAQINATSKLFSRSSNKYTNTPNYGVSLFDASIPGTLPIINRYCVEATVKSGLAFNCTINEKCFFDRKHYFYPDSPNGYQITQKREPIATDGYINFVLPKTKIRENEIKRVSLKQIQLEQDTGKTLKDIKSGAVYIDLNRCGIGLMEFVFEPELYHYQEAYYLVKELIQVLKRIDTCSCKMEEGALRVDANVSVSPVNGPAGNRIELKNLNSLQSLTKGLEFEVSRHLDALKKGLLVPSETRFYDPIRKKTFPMRDKDNVEDYRYMPEPNLPPLKLAQEMIETDSIDDQVISVTKIAETIPSLPEDERDILMNTFKLPIETAHLLIENNLFSFYVSIMDLRPIYTTARVGAFVARELSAILNDNQVEINGSNVTPQFILDSFDLVEKGVITMNIVQDIIQLAIDGDQRSAREIVKEHGWWLTQNEKLITSKCLSIVDESPIAAYNAKRGANFSIDWLTEKVLKQTDLKSTKNMIRSTIKLILEGRDLKDLKKLAIKAEKKSKEGDDFILNAKIGRREID